MIHALKRSPFGIATALVLAVVAALAACNPSFQPSDDSATVKVSAFPEKAAVHPGDKLVIAIVMQIAPGWHTWPAQDVLPKDIAEFAIRTEIGLPAQPPWVASIDGLQMPEPKPAKVADPSGGPPITVPTYSDTSVGFMGITVSPSASTGDQTLEIEIKWQACNDNVCQAPDNATVKVPVRIVPASQPLPSAPARSPIFQQLKPFTAPPPPPAAAGAPVKPITVFGVALPTGPLGLFALMLVAILFGALMNLTPCVLPVIPIKVMTLTQHAGSPGRGITLGLWMFLGVAFFWTLIGVPMAFISSALDPSRYIFGTWWVTLTLGLLIALMGLGIMGLFTLNLPQSVYMINPKADTARGSFVFGIMTAVLGLPCYGFLAGGLLAGAATLPSASIMIVFVGLGVGMGAPYLILAAKPALVEKIPRTGPASELVKQVMGLLLLAAAAFFAGSGLHTLASDKPYLSEPLIWWSASFFVVIASLWLVVRTLQISRRPGVRFTMVLLGALLSAGMIFFSLGMTRSAREEYLKKQQSESATFVPGTWNQYTPAAYQAALKSGRTIVLDFTASWCIICKSLKRGVLDQSPVREELAKDDVVSFEVDLSSSSSPGWKFLNDFERTGVPTLIVLGPGTDGEKNPVILSAYTWDPLESTCRHASLSIL